MHAKKPRRARRRIEACRRAERCVSVAAMAPALIFNMCREEEWRAALASGCYAGSDQDAADGFIHFSTAAQIEQSAARHRAGQHGLVLLSVDPAELGAD